MAAWPTTAWTGWPTMRRPGPRTRRCPPSAVPLPTADDVVTGNRFRSLVILTGAGISAESGLGTFRDKDGLWTQYDLNDVATPEGFLRNPRSEEHTSELQSLMRNSYAVFCLKKKKKIYMSTKTNQNIYSKKQ